MDDARKKQLEELFTHVDEREQVLVRQLLEEVLSLEDRMRELRKLPFIKVHPSNANLQKATPASRIYKESMQSYMNALRILLNILRKVDNSAADELLERLSEFTLGK